MKRRRSKKNNTSARLAVPFFSQLQQKDKPFFNPNGVKAKVGDTVADKNGHSADVTGKSGQAPIKPLRLVFFLQNAKMKQQAEVIAKSANAVKLPYFIKKGFIGKSTGSIPCAKHGNVIKRSADYAKKMGTKVEMLHVVGHNFQTSGPACLHGSITSDMIPYFSPNLKLIVHGCLGTARFKYKNIIKQLPGSAVYLHSQCSDPGGPLDFTKVTKGEGKTPKKTMIDNIVKEKIGFTNEVVQLWVQKVYSWLLGKAGKFKKEQAENFVEFYFDYDNSPAFRSAETAALARFIITAPKVSNALKKAAKQYLKQWNEAQDPYD